MVRLSSPVVLSSFCASSSLNRSALLPVSLSITVGAIAFTSYLKSQFSLVFSSSGWSDGEDDELEVAWRAKELAASASFEDESATLDAASVNGKGPTLEESKVKSRVAAVVEKKEEEEQGMRLRTSGHDRDHDQEKRKA